MREAIALNAPVLAVEALPQRPARVRKRQKIESCEAVEERATAKVSGTEDAEGCSGRGNDAERILPAGGAEDPSSSHPDVPPGAQYECEYADGTMLLKEGGLWVVALGLSHKHRGCRVSCL